MDGRIDTTDGRSLRTRLIDACDLDDVETRAGFRLAEVWGRYDFAMGRRRQAASPSYEAGRGRDARVRSCMHHWTPRSAADVPKSCGV